MEKDEFLTHEELETLTGYEKPRKQIEWLRTNNWRYIENAKGIPVVSRTYCRQKLSDSVPAAPVQNSWQPDFSALMA